MLDLRLGGLLSGGGSRGRRRSRGSVRSDAGRRDQGATFDSALTPVGAFTDNIALSLLGTDVLLQSSSGGEVLMSVSSSGRVGGGGLYVSLCRNRGDDITRLF